MRCNPGRWFWGLLPIAILTWIAVLAERERIETDLRQRTQQALAGRALGWAEPRFEGRDGVLAGHGQDEKEPNKARRTAEEVWGVRLIEDRTELVDRVNTYVWSASLRGNRVKILGYVPNEATQRAIMGVAKAAFPTSEVTDRMRLARGGPARDTWLGGVSFALKQLSSLKRGSAYLNGGDLSVAGEAESPAAFNSVKSALKNNVPAGITIASDKVTAPVVRPYVWEAQLSGGQLLLTGHVPTEGRREKILEKAKGLLPETAVIDRTELAEGDPRDWTHAVSFALAQLSRLREGRATIRDHDVHVSGVAADEATAAAVRTAVERSLPQHYKATAKIQAREPAEPADAKRESGANRAREEAGAEARRKADEEIAANEARLAGERNKREEAEKRAAEEAQRLAARQMTPEVEQQRKAEADTCQRLMDAEAGKGVIRFDLSSAVIDDASFPSLGKLAEIAKQCPAARVEIEGHTDSEGPPAINLILSDQRAQAVVSWLTNAGVEPSRLSAIGYGETRPAAPNSSAANRARNRRIRFTVKSN